MENHPELGYGIMRMPQKDNEVDWSKSKLLIDEYMKGDYCYFDTHPAYMMGQSQRIIKECVVKKYDRKRFLLANKMPYWTMSDYRDYNRIFQNELDACGVQYFDFYLLHAVTKDVYAMHERAGGFHFLKKIKANGKAKKIGMSFHDNHKLLDEILNRHPEIEFVQLQINYFDWENPLIQSKACYEVARKYNKDIFVMEPIKGGRLVLEDSGKYAREALNFVKALPGIQVILSGMSEINHIVENRITLTDVPKGELDFAAYETLRHKVERENPVPCTECRYCELECPKGVRIPDIFSLLNAYEKPGHDRADCLRIKLLYHDFLMEKGRAGECVDCGKCEIHCPQKIEIRKHIKRAQNLFEKKYFYTSERNAQILISLLKQYGIRKVITSPGTTNIAFVYSVQQDDSFEVYSAPDERSAAYMACGLSTESGEPVVISCTGATASRNYLPGLTEAYYRHIPVIAVTSAQPDVRIGHNIPQVIDRTCLPNDVVKLSLTLPIVKSYEDERMCVINANKALNELYHRGIGPVHINLITDYSKDFSVMTLPHTQVIRRIQMEDLYPEIPNGKIGIFCGAHKEWDREQITAAEKFCEIYSAVIICDHTSNYAGKFRCTPSFLEKNSRERSLDDIDLLIHIGDVSGAYFSIKAREVWRVHPNGEYCDTFGSLSNVFEMDEQTFFELYLKDGRKPDKKQGVKKWSFTEKARDMRRLDLPFSNAWIASQTAHRLPKNTVLHLGILNSLRTWNFYQISESVRVYSNTGGFGIDGCLSSLIGASLSDPKKLYFGVLGDLAFFYDMNVLGNRHVGDNLRLMIVNNGGGTEFKNYTHPAYLFEELADPYIAARGHYGQKSDRLLKNYVQDLGFEYRFASTKEEYIKILPEFVNPERRNSSLILEVFTDSESESEALRMLNDEKAAKAKELPISSDVVVPKWFQNLEEKEIVLWGCGAVFLRDLAKVEQHSKIRYVCDNNQERWDQEIMPGIRCISPDELKQKNDIFVVIMLEDANIGFEIGHQLQRMGINNFDLVKHWLKYASQMKWKTI